jgi:galactokinase/CTP:molybdopterin cytidylyltransferase MocA
MLVQWPIDRAAEVEMEDKHQVSRQLNLIQRFQEIYGEGEVQVATAPARINIIGEHIDYVEYFKTAVLPFGSAEHNMLMAFRPRPDGLIKARTLASGFEPREFSVAEFDPSSTRPRDVGWMDYLSRMGVPPTSWDNYVKASVFYLQHLHPHRQFEGVDLLVDSEIPIAGGASSSSALVVASGIAMRCVSQIGLDLDELAESSSRAEWFVGTRGGKMDHATMCFSQPSSALLITFKPFTVKSIPMPPSGYKWVTFYTHPAEKGSAVMSEYNERSAVSRFIIPKLLRDLFAENERLREEWDCVLDAIARRDDAGLREKHTIVQEVLRRLPERMVLRDLGEMTDELRGLYPALFQTKGLDFSLKVRDRAAHHLGEMGRVIQAADCLAQAYAYHLQGDIAAEESEMCALGGLLYQTHASLRDLYEVSTPELDQVVDISREVDGVFGARVMGGGFGGNVLVLVRSDRVPALVDSVRSQYYSPQGRAESPQSRTTVSTPGMGACLIPKPDLLRFTLAGLLNEWRTWEANEGRIMSVAEEIVGSKAQTYRPLRPVKPVLIAAGKGERARRSGLRVPKPLALVHGEPVIRCVFTTLRSLPFATERAVVVVSPETEADIRAALSGCEADFAVQERPLGTADAVLSSKSALGSFDGDVVVMWGTQPCVQAETVLRTILLHQALGCSSMSFPTAKREHPYAPVRRDADCWVIDSVETHLEGAERVEFGEDNIGLFVLPKSELFRTLDELHAIHYLPEEGRYDTPEGELGFPNLMVRRLAHSGKPVFAFAMADPRETQGIKTAGDSQVVESYISELRAGDQRFTRR